jgi:hypothetical protein
VTKTKTKAASAKKTLTAAQHKKREGELLVELCSVYGYAFADTLRDGERTSMIMDRRDGKTTIRAAYGIKLIVPSDGTLGVQIAAGRKERDPATSKSARARAKANAKAKAKAAQVSP